jgi:alpha-maltose-1-phosphate synthase
MKILYVAGGIPVPGTIGGSTHTLEVARGLAQRGHSVHLVAATQEGWGGLGPFVRPVTSRLEGFHLHHLDVPKRVALLGFGPVFRLMRAFRPDVVIDRYYNFAGTGVWAAHRLGIPCLLEVNALIVDPPEVPKRRLDDALGGPMRRWALTQCRWAARIVTPLHTTVPPEIPRSKIVELPWGADVARFAPPAELPISAGQPPTVLFLGTFRPWHGVIDFVRAGALLLASGRDCRFVLIGDGPERRQAERLASAWPGHFQFTGPLPYEQLPERLHRAAVGVAPFRSDTHPALRAAGFFWSPIKIFEYMAAGLPVVTSDMPPLNDVIREGQEGALFRAGDVADLAAAMARLLDDPAAARAMGRRARARAVENFSWQRHCAELERVLIEMVGERTKSEEQRTKD